MSDVCEIIVGEIDASPVCADVPQDIVQEVPTDNTDALKVLILPLTIVAITIVVIALVVALLTWAEGQRVEAEQMLQALERQSAKAEENRARHPSIFISRDAGGEIDLVTYNDVDVTNSFTRAYERAEMRNRADD